MTSRTAITVNRPRDEVQRLWAGAGHGYEVTFRDAPGDRGTEIHLDLGKGSLLQKVAGAGALAKAKDHLRRFKQQVETGEVPRSDGMPVGESAERKLKPRPAQPLAEEAGVR